MIGTLFNTILYNPLLNSLVFLTSIVPGADVGLAIVILTILVRLALLPLSEKALATQSKMRLLEPKLRAIREKYKDDKQAQALHTMELYKQEGMNPFSGILIMLIQIPILIALYLVFSKGIPTDTTVLYSFVHLPSDIHFTFMNLFNLAEPNHILSLLSGISQFIQMQLAVPPLLKKDPSAPASMSDDFARSMNMNMRYVMPVIIAIIGFKLPAAIVLYWVTNNIFMIGHELYRRHRTQLTV